VSELIDRQPVEDWSRDFDHFDPAFVADPDKVWGELRERCPVAHSDRYGGVVVTTRWQDIADVAHDTGTFSSRRVVISEVPTSHHGLPLPPINDDPPVHTARRRVMLSFFSPRGVERWVEPVRDICRRALDVIDDRRDVDLAVDYAQVIPAELTAQMLGVHLEDVPMFRQWLHQLLEIGPNDAAVLSETSRAIRAYMADLLEERKGTGGDDLVAFLLDQRVDGAPFTDAEMVNILFLLLIAGIDTTWSAIGSSLLHLARHPDDRRRLAADPSLIPTAVEEFLRFYPPVWVARIATTDTEIAGCPVAEGDWVVMGIPSANRDSSVYDQPDEVLIDRLPNRHATFGLGVHRCLGSNLARMEVMTAIEEWLARFPEFELTEAEAVTYSAGQIRGPRTVPARIAFG
jgi:cytochrome P450